MAAKENKILPFAINIESNDILTDKEYETDVTRTDGNIIGIAKRRPNNKALKQATLIASALAELICRGTKEDGSKDDGYDVNDALPKDTIEQYLRNVFVNIVKDTAGSDDKLVHIENAETITGAKTFTSKIIASGGVELSTDPAGDNDAARKKYIDNNFTLLPVNGNSNANTFTVPRRYACESTIANLPVEKSGYIDVYRVSNSNTIVQVYYPADNTSIYARNSTDGGTEWGEWKLQTISDLSAYVKSVNQVKPDTSGNVNITIPDPIARCYPVGSIYLSVDAEFNPNTVFTGTTWVKIENRFLLASGTKAVGATGGEENVTLSTAQMPSHYHGVGSITTSGTTQGATLYTSGRPSGFINQSGAFTGSGQGDEVDTEAGVSRGGVQTLQYDMSRNRSGNTGSNGSGKAHNNMPPYLVVAIWKRTK